MNDDQTQRARRWRWITFAELLAVATVIISALALFDAHNARTQAQADQRKAAVSANQLSLTATAENDGRSLKLSPAAAGQVIQAQTIRFPAALGVTPPQTTGDPRIDANWFAEGLKKARKVAGESDESPGDERLPVAIETQYLAEGVVRRDHAIYDLGYSISGHFLGGSSIKLHGLALLERLGAGDPSAKLDALWRSRHHRVAPSS